MIRIGLNGSTGRMGRSIQELLAKDAQLAQEFQIVWAPARGETQWPSILPQVVIDFSSPVGSLAIARLCASRKIPLLICTTGFTLTEERELGNILEDTSWAWVPNTSLGIHALHCALEAVMPLLKSYRISISETHHIHKKDKPSGTAKALVSTLEPIFGNQFPVESVRQGDVIGVHTVKLEGEGETLEFTHRATDRTLFARGALTIAKRFLAFSAMHPRGPVQPRDLLLC